MAGWVTDGGNVKIETLVEFITLVKCRSFSRAAVELYVSQPSLSAHIAAMEKELGFDVLERDSNHFALTSAGASFLTDAQAIVALYEEARGRGIAAAHEDPPVRMASLAHDSSLFRALAARDDLKVSFVDLDFNTLVVDALVEGIIDVGTCSDFRSISSLRDRVEAANIAFLPTGEEYAAIAMMRSHPLAEKLELTVSDINGMTVTIGSYAHFDEWKSVVSRMFGDDIRLVYRLKPIESMADLVRDDLGDTLHICGRKAVERFYLNRDDVVVFDRLDGKPLRYPSGIAYRLDCGNKRLAPFVEALAEIIVEEQKSCL